MSCFLIVESDVNKGRFIESKNRSIWTCHIIAFNPFITGTYRLQGIGTIISA